MLPGNAAAEMPGRVLRGLVIGKASGVPLTKQIPGTSRGCYSRVRQDAKGEKIDKRCHSLVNIERSFSRGPWSCCCLDVSTCCHGSEWVYNALRHRGVKAKWPSTRRHETNGLMEAVKLTFCGGFVPAMAAYRQALRLFHGTHYYASIV